LSFTTIFEPPSSLPESQIPSVANELVAALRAPDAPRELRMFAARGLLPLERKDRIRALLTVLPDGDEAVASTARQTLQEVPLDELTQFLDDAEPTERELHVVSLYSDDPFVLGGSSISDETLPRAASVSGAAVRDRGQVRLLRPISSSAAEMSWEAPALELNGSSGEAQERALKPGTRLRDLSGKEARAQAGGGRPRRPGVQGSGLGEIYASRS
jgi:hypothetical protein